MTDSVESVEKKVEAMTVGQSSGDGEAIYTSESRGSDESGEGTYKVPFKTVLQAMRRHGKEPFPVIYQVGDQFITGNDGISNFRDTQ